MFSIKNVPIVIEPGVNALEVELSINDPEHGHRVLPVKMERVNLDEAAALKLPFIPTNRFPHVFSIVSSLDKSAALVVFDSFGRIGSLYTRDARHVSWDRFDIAEEHSGKSVTQFSVRLVFNTQKDRFRFLQGMEKIVRQISRDETPDINAVIDALRPLARSRVSPIVVPVAIDKNKMGRIKL